MPASPPPGGTITPRAKAIAQYAAMIAKLLPGTYQGNNAAYRGETWEQVYLAMVNAAPGVAPLVIANKVAGLAAVQGVALGVGGGTTQLGNFANDAGKSGTAINFGGFGSVLDFLNALGDPHLWLRIAEGILGIILIATAVSKMTGAGSAVGKVARKVPLVV